MGDVAVVERAALTKPQARKLTDRICDTAENLWSLLLEAHEGRAWQALGYDTWDAYVDQEFPISRGQSYRLLDQGRAIVELSAAAGVPALGAGSVTVSGRAAEELKPVLEHVADEVRDKTKGKRKTERAAIAADVVDHARQALGAGEPTPPDVSRARDTQEQEPKPDKGSSTPPPETSRGESQATRAAEVIPRLVRTNPREVAEAMPQEQRAKYGRELLRWAEAVEREARGFGATTRDDPGRKDCQHPMSRRIGAYCAACGQTVK